MKARCLSPVRAWQCGFLACKSDKVISPRLVFSRQEAENYHAACGTNIEDHAIDLPCGHCAACLIAKRRDMSTRLCHEAHESDRMCFLTLTYDKENIPTTDVRPIDSDQKVYSRGFHDLSFDSCELPLQTLLPSDVQKFMKRLRRHLEYVPVGCKVVTRPDGCEIVVDGEGNFVRDHAPRIRYFAVGEYGGKTRRPHYHILIFGWCPTDREFFTMRKKKPVYISNTVQRLWPFGFETVGDVNPRVCKYCARYVTKKFISINKIDTRVVPEFTLQSVREGGIGALWFMKYGSDAVRLGFCTVRNGDNIIKCRVPPYYLSLTRKHNLPLWLDVRGERLEFIRAHKGDAPKMDDLQRSCDKFIYNARKFQQDDLF